MDSKPFAPGVRLFASTPRYYQGPDALDRLPGICAPLARKPAIVVDADVLALTGTRLAKLFGERPHLILPFSGEVTLPAMIDLADTMRLEAVDLVVGMGGGKALDAAKGAAIRADLNFVTVPTVASNDSPISMGLAAYDDHHRVVAIETHSRNPEAVIVDTRLIAGAPARFLLAGIGDAVAKKFEAEASLRDGGLTAHFTRQLRTAGYIADGCYSTIREHGEAAMAAAGTGEPTDALEAVIEANILMAGLSFENMGLGLAHAMTRGLVRTAVVDRAPHGFHVAYGLLVQLVAEGRAEAMIDDLIDFYRRIGLPRSLIELGLDAIERKTLVHVAANVTQAPAGAYLVVPYTADEIVAAMQNVEARFAPIAGDAIHA
ncbi:glycerol dehydrogenase [Sphingobium wenxiniae]|uniref:Glycerol dehydrogenase n=2 Tax=Sphingobium TaxID=165695 RepID=T0G4F4_9SPHN|nr:MULTISPECIES: iron-containing alcohol dehydrogenase [Sphingobium]EQA98565.1 hypothetical protein L485_17935 [Sphingobium baderi LL03]KMS61617.1 hypothetical protein V475_12510 [Sphingobium baderi LL03]MBB6193250.1 glycerol dehydrogenase [Sphingobium wenxiniae]TWH91433.1 glycerol dehydrogenase [Sphingobium wenxiniae]